MKQHGYTLLELVLAIAIGAIILSGAVVTIYQIMVTTRNSSRQVVALADVNSAALAIKRDLMMAQTTDLNQTPQNSANLSWIDFTSFGSSNQTTHSAIYTLSGKQLRRTFDGAVGIVGRNITAVSFSQQDNYVTVVLTGSNTSAPSQVESITFGAHLRTEELE